MYCIQKHKTLFIQSFIFHSMCMILYLIATTFLFRIHIIITLLFYCVSNKRNVTKYFWNSISLFHRHIYYSYPHCTRTYCRNIGKRMSKHNFQLDRTVIVVIHPSPFISSSHCYYMCYTASNKCNSLLSALQYRSMNTNSLSLKK